MSTSWQKGQDAAAQLSLLRDHVEDLALGRVLVVGDVMLDTYLEGDAQRISPEAPVPVVRIDRTRHLLGGAGNVARNITALGGHSDLVALVGKDESGNDIQAMLEQAGVGACLLRSPERPTTVKTRVLARHQQMLRLDQESSAPLSETEYQVLLNSLEKLLPRYDTIIISDYGKGLITPRLLPELHRMAEANAPRILVDPKPQNRLCYSGAWLLTPNTKETGETAGMPVSTRADLLRAGRNLRESLHAQHVLTTLGADGMALFSAEGPVWHVETTAQQVFDVTGAGDTVIAVTALALSAGFPLLCACVLSNYAAGIVVGKVGAATASLPELRAALLARAPSLEQWDS